MVAANLEAIAGLAHIPSKGSKRVSWNAAHIAIRFMRVSGKMDFVFWDGCSQPEHLKVRLPQNKELNSFNAYAA